MSFTLLSDRVAILPDEAPKEKTTDSGLVIPLGDAGPLRPVYGEVRHVGIGHRSEHSSQLVPIDVEVGQRVMFHESSGEEWEIEGTKYKILPPSAIIAIDTTG